MKKYNKIVISCMSIFLLASCSSEFLEYEPTGVLSSVNVATAENAESLVTAAYAAIGNDEMVGPITHQWVYGSVRSDDAYKGGGGRGDVDVIDRYEQYNTTIADYGDWMTPKTWTNHYKAISRANFALSVINSIPDADYPEKKVRQAELRFLRAHSHFMLKLLFNKVPYITEDLTQEQILKTSNDLTSDALWDKIAADFQFAFDNLQQSQDQVGRADKNAAAAYLAKLNLYQAYKQNDAHQVTSIDAAKLQKV
ncbi:MAG: RagB/SusD family nutrient uptake outer membrane protein, partial [Crocinitomicaceae bacterium]|nr:RagB/SusD family nutrient uptake outer membrane protein [Crocinitomicaceae bacterium]